MMPSDRTPSIDVGILCGPAPATTAITGGATMGRWRASVWFDRWLTTVSIQGPAAALRELAAALVAAADQAEEAEEAELPEPVVGVAL